MKRLSLCLSLLLVLLLCPFAGAEQEAVTFSHAGVTLPLPPTYLAHLDSVSLSADENLYGDGVSTLSLVLYPADLQSVYGMTEAQLSALRAQACPLLKVFGMENGTEPGLLQWMEKHNWDQPDSLTLLGEAEGFVFFRTETAALLPEISAELSPVVQAIADELYAADMTFFRPTGGITSTDGARLVFETTDLDGNPVSGTELFAASRITMLNVWASWCPPCIGELSELEALNHAFADKGCAVVGLLYDGDDPAALASGRASLARAGAGYLNLLPDPELLDQLPLQAFPTTWFVASDGTVLGNPIVGAAVAQYEQALDALLAELG